LAIASAVLDFSGNHHRLTPFTQREIASIACCFTLSATASTEQLAIGAAADRLLCFTFLG
jgi:hypothetical protein